MAQDEIVWKESDRICCDILCWWRKVFAPEWNEVRISFQKLFNLPDLCQKSLQDHLVERPSRFWWFGDLFEPLVWVSCPQPLSVNNCFSFCCEPIGEQKTELMFLTSWKSVMTRLSLCARHQTWRNDSVTTPRSCCTSLFKWETIPLNRPTMLYAPSVATETSIVNGTLIRFSRSKTNRARSYPEEASHTETNRGNCSSLFSNENLTVQTRMWSCPKMDVSRAIEKNLHASKWLAIAASVFRTCLSLSRRHER